METYITTFPSELGWWGRKFDFRLFQQSYGKEEKQYSIFKFTETKRFERHCRELNTKKEYVYVCKGDLARLLADLKVYNFDKNELLETDLGVLQLKLIQTTFNGSGFVLYPKKRMVEGIIYQVTEEEFQGIPFPSEPITSRRDRNFAVQLDDSVKINDELENYFSTHFRPLTTNENLNDKMKYRPIHREEAKEDVPKEVNQKAFALAKEHDLNILEFNFLNYLYETGRTFRNGEGQFLYDMHNGKTWGYLHDRKWVKRKMERLIHLGLVTFEIRHDCRDPRCTSWYFYDANANLDELECISHGR